MCGIAGFLCPHNFDPDSAKTVAISMRDALVHRGPDDAGLWMDVSNGVVMTHRRLSILDLSSAGHQPMVSPTGRFVICFNGEIYNHLDLRRQLARSAWSGGSDTETIMACIEEWGLITTLKRCVGMFALALWDREERRLALSRDRLGEKPLYYGWQGKTFLFASELKAIKRHPDFLPEINRKVIPRFLKLGYIPGPESIWKGIYKLEPGCVVWINTDNSERSIEREKYWSLSEVIASGRRHPFQGNLVDATDELEERLLTATQQQMISDVPLGVFLSGGIDSSIIAAMMQKCSTSAINTFSIGFEAESHNEAPYAKQIANHLGTNHDEFYVSSSDVQGLLANLVELYDEPFADSSQIPTVLLAQHAAKKVKVALTGDGGDELFAGYSRYFHIQKHFDLINRTPATARKIMSMLTRFASRHFNNNDTLTKFHLLISAEPVESIYGIYQSKTHIPLTNISENYNPYYADIAMWPEPNNYIEWMMAADINTYLPDDLLVKVDRAAMGSSLETRAPFLNHELYQFCWSLPSSFKYNNNSSKHMLKKLLENYIPKSLFDRPKKGFSIPIGNWLRSDLNEFASSHLEERSLKSAEFFNIKRISELWVSHKNGARDHSATLWHIIILAAWLQKNR
jgi:asparagine synthase (glutamine-hydrolysing)